MTAARSAKRKAIISKSYASIDITLAGRRINICLDSGSPISLVDQKLIDTLTSVTNIVTASKKRIRGVGGAIVHATKVAEITIHLDGKTPMMARAYLMPSLNANIILGVDFLLEHGVDLRFTDITLKFANTVLPIKIYTSRVEQRTPTSSKRAGRETDRHLAKSQKETSRRTARSPKQTSERTTKPLLKINSCPAKSPHESVNHLSPLGETQDHSATSPKEDTPEPVKSRRNEQQTCVPLRKTSHETPRSPVEDSIPPTRLTQEAQGRIKHAARKTAKAFVSRLRKPGSQSARRPRKMVKPLQGTTANGEELLRDTPRRNKKDSDHNDSCLPTERTTEYHHSRRRESSQEAMLRRQAKTESTSRKTLSRRPTQERLVATKLRRGQTQEKLPGTKPRRSQTQEKLSRTEPRRSQTHGRLSSTEPRRHQNEEKTFTAGPRRRENGRRITTADTRRRETGERSASPKSSRNEDKCEQHQEMRGRPRGHKDGRQRPQRVYQEHNGQLIASPSDIETKTPGRERIWQEVEIPAEGLLDVAQTFGEEDECNPFASPEEHAEARAKALQSEAGAHLGGIKVGPQPKSMEHKGAYGVTIYGTKDRAEKINALLEEFPSLFTDDGKSANISEEQRMTIPLVSDWKQSGVKLAHKTYPLGPKDRALIDEKFDKLHSQDRMAFTEGATPFAFPVFVVWKEVKGKMQGRPVVDIRGLNRITVTDAYPMPLQTDITSAVAGCPFISVMDMTSFFYQWPIAERDRHKLTVVSHRGSEYFKVAVMGFKNSPPYVQRQIDRILREYRCQLFAKAFVDDVATYSKTFEEHLEHLRRIFTAFDDMNLTLSPHKTFLGFPSIELLGQHVDSMGMSTSAEKLEAIAKLSFPRTAKDLEHYLGLTGWLRNYIPYYAQLAEPLQKCKKDIFRKAPQGAHARRNYAATSTVDQSAEMMEAFQALQREFVKPSMLHHFDRSRPLYIHTDASKRRGFGVMVAHLEGDAVTGDPPRTKTQPILFLSKTLSSPETRYWPTELEVACLVWAMKRIRWMVEACDKPVVVLTDHAGTTSIATQTSLSSSSVDKLNNRLIRASQYLQQFRNIKVMYKPGREHIVPDALSRLPAPGTSEEDTLGDLLDVNATTMLAIDEKFKSQLILAYDQDKHFSRVKAVLQVAEHNTIPFHQDEDGLIWLEDDVGQRLCIPRAMEGDIFDAAHDEQYHVGFHRLHARIAPQYFIRKLSSRLKKYLRHCHECRRLQTVTHAPYGALHPIKSPTLPFHTITIDFIVALPEADGFNSVLTATCKASKRIMIIPGRDDYAADAWAHRLLDGLLQCDWGLPTVIISDRDPKFTSIMWKTIFERLGSKLLMSTAYHPQTDGQSERTNQTVEVALRYYMAKYPDGAVEWCYVVPHIQFILNNSINATTGCSPNEFNYGFRPRESADITTKSGVTDVALERDVLRREAADSAAYAQVIMKQRYDKKHTAWTPQVGSQVYLSLRNYSIPGVTNRKLSPQRVGPYMVKRVTRSGLACEIDLPRHWKIHPVISIAELEPLTSEEDPFKRVKRLPQKLRVDDETAQSTPKLLLQRRSRKVGRKGTELVEYLTRWSDDPGEDRWERQDNIPADMVKKFNRRRPT